MNWYLLISLSVLCLAHYCHSHSHLHEPPAYKYSQAANAKPDPAAHHGHSHDHHGHSHDHHGHSHDHHGHSHDHHGHSHDHHGHSHDHHGHSHDKPQPSQESSASAASASHVSAPPGGANHWMEAILATVLISIAPVFILLLVPLENTEAHEPTLKVLLSFASGGLLGDAFLHLIPHAMDPHVVDQHSGDQQHHHEHGHSHDHTGHMRIGLWVVAGILAFLLVEKVIRFLKSEAGISHSHSHSHSVSAMPAPAPAAVAPSSTSSSSQTSEKSKKGGKSSTGDEASFRQRGVSSTSSSSDTVAQKAPKVKKASSEDAAAPPAVVIVPNADIKVAGYLNLAADFAHNFTDGLAIGASFLMGRGIGMVTTVTILFHEVPHEIGDFAILLQSGCSKKKAILLQLSTALGALLGTTVSLIAGASAQTSAATSWIMPFTAGGFIYIATVAVIPDLLRDTAPCQSVKEIIALLCGVGMMLVIGFYE